MQRERSGSGPDGRVADHRRFWIDDLDGVVIAGADQDFAAVLGDRDAARALPDRTVLTVFIWSRSITLNGIVALVCDIGQCRSMPAPVGHERQQRQGQPCRNPRHYSLHRVSGRSKPSVSSSVTWCRKPGCGETETTDGRHPAGLAGEAASPSRAA